MCEYCGCTPKDVKKPLKELPLLGSEIKIVKRPKEVSLFYQNRRMGWKANQFFHPSGMLDYSVYANHHFILDKPGSRVILCSNV